MKLRWRELIVLLQTLTVIYVTLAEPFYQRRDHLDQVKYLKNRNENIVKNTKDAKFVLSKYGYLVCPVNRWKRSAANTKSFFQLTPSNPYSNLISKLAEGGGQACDDQNFKKAIRNYQQNYNLPQTGKLDEQTKSFMSTSRCGNRDSTKDNREPEKFTNVLVEGEKQTQPEYESNQSQTPRQRLWKRSLAYQQSKLYKVLSGKMFDKPKTRGHKYYKNHLEQYVAKLREKAKGNKKILHKYTPLERKKRTVHVWTSGDRIPLGKYLSKDGQLFNKDIVRWRLLTSGFSTRIPVEDQRATIDLAFRMWSEVIPLRFVEDTSSDINTVDIEIAFGKGSHQNCDHDFDGNGGEVAHSQDDGNTHFDDEENFKSIRSYSSEGIYLLRVAVHEIGHVLGLGHTNNTQSIMYAIYRGAQLSPEFELSLNDRKDMQTIYGVCKGTFNTVFDWVRRRPDNQFIYNTYFFRDNHYWMYENHANRTRYGDPLYIAREWDGVPNQLDGYAHIWLFNGNDYLDDAYFFKGEHYYKYDSEHDKVMEGWPKLISEDFPPKQDQTEAIPSNIDSVFFDARDKNLYFFKNDDVYVYDPNAPEEERGCCVRKAKIVDEYPAAEGHKPLPANLNSVYYSYKDKMMYFMKGEELWRNKLFDPRQRRVHNSVEYLGPWYEKWRDICDVVVMNEH